MSGYPDGFIGEDRAGLIETRADRYAQEDADAAYDAILAHNQRIADAIARCAAELRKIGEPELFLNDHYDFDDVVRTLELDFGAPPSPESLDKLMRRCLEAARENV